MQPADEAPPTEAAWREVSPPELRWSLLYGPASEGGTRWLLREQARSGFRTHVLNVSDRPTPFEFVMEITSLAGDAVAERLTNEAFSVLPDAFIGGMRTK